MIFLYKAVRKQIEKRRTPGVSPAVNRASNDVSAAPIDVCQPDEEANTPDCKLRKTTAIGQPIDPANARSKRWSYVALLIMGFTLAIDYSMALMSIQPLYYLVQGRDSLYGLTFGSFDLSSMLWAPVFGFWHDRSSSFKPQFLTGAVLNAIGNFIYGFTLLVDGWWMMLIARLVAGIGVATLGLGGSYLTKTTTIEERQLKLGRYRISQNVARMVGPTVGYIFLGLPDASQASSTALRIFNWYTIPGWVAGVTVVSLIPLFVWLFCDPTEENEHLVKHEMHAEAVATTTPERERKFKWLTYQWLALSFLVVFSAMSFYCNLFGLLAGQYHAVTKQTENWKTFLAAGVGSMVAAFTYRRMVKSFPKFWDERILSLAGSWLIFVVWMMTIPWGGKTWVPPLALFYASTAIMGFGTVLTLTTMETYMSKKVTQYQDVVSDRVGWWLGLFYMAVSAGRFLGPLVMGAVTRIATPSGDTHFCSEFGPDGFTCIGPPEEQCILLGTEYYIYGCILHNAIIFYPIMAGLQLVVCIGLHIVVARNWSYHS